ncbi:MAG: hypothetical protein GX456_09635 [Verrucomicrobia bacterium]|nr:hypothetical protein [Verrucomicrobiota bacterium]
MAETINCAAMHKAVVLVGHRSANGAAYTSVGRSPTTRPISRTLSTSQGLKARTITAPFSCVWCFSWLGVTLSAPGAVGGLIRVVLLATESQRILRRPACPTARWSAEAAAARRATLVPAGPGWKICGLSSQALLEDFADAVE